jgi:hypothetical protein
MKRLYYFSAMVLALFMVACGDDNPEEGTAPEIENSDDEFLKYRGEWNGNLGFVGLPMSIKVEEYEPGKFRGDLWMTYTYTSCCGSLGADGLTGGSDGKMSYEVSGSNITKVIWASVIPTCNGLFTGSGTIKTNGDLEFDITGTDCDGNHVTKWTLEEHND